MRARAKPEPATHRLSIRVDLASGARIGPGKIALLEQIGRTGSISAAGRALRMSYRRAWELVEELNRNVGCPVVTTAAGGSGGGGASLTAAGIAVIAEYRAIETAAKEAASPHIAALAELGGRSPRVAAAPARGHVSAARGGPDAKDSEERSCPPAIKSPARSPG
jgi:molybdate transport system regulatory protein